MSYSTITQTSQSISASQIDDPQTLSGLFPPDSDDDDDDDADKANDNEDIVATRSNDPNCYEIQSINFVGKTILVRQYDYHSHNANRIWPGAFPLAEYLLQERSTTSVTAQLQDSSIDRRRSGKYVHQWGRILELGAATGLLAMRLAMASTEMYHNHNQNQNNNSDNNFNKIDDATTNNKIDINNSNNNQCCCCTSIVTSDVDDEYGDIATNLLYNYTLNHMTLPLQSLPYHIPHTWGTGFQQSIQNVIDQEIADNNDNIITPTFPKNTASKCCISDQETPTLKKNIHNYHNIKINHSDTLLPHPLLLPFDTIIASDILLYVSSYPALVATLSELMILPPLSSAPLVELEDTDGTTTTTMSPLAAATITTTTNTKVVVALPKPQPTKFIMSWNRRLKESQEFFVRMTDAGFIYEHHGKGIYTFVYNDQRNLCNLVDNLTIK